MFHFHPSIRSAQQNKLFVLSKFPFCFFFFILPPPPHIWCDVVLVLCVHVYYHQLLLSFPSTFYCFNAIHEFFFIFLLKAIRQWIFRVCVCDGCMWKGQLDVFLLFYSLLPLWFVITKKINENFFLLFYFYFFNIFLVVNAWVFWEFLINLFVMN